MSEHHLARPAKVAVHPAGVVVADSYNDRVLVVALDGQLLAEHGELRTPTGVATAADGSLLVCEEEAEQVVRIPPGSGTRLTFLGGLFLPADVAVASDGTAYVAEAGRHRIWRVMPDGSISVLAGTGEQGLEDAYGPASRFDEPTGLAAGPLGLFVVDAGSSALRVVDATHRVATLIGRGKSRWEGEEPFTGLQHPKGVACAPDGSSVYVADTSNSSLRLWSGVDGHLRRLPVEGLHQPSGLDVLADGRLVVADTGNDRVVLVDLAAETVEPLMIRS